MRRTILALPLALLLVLFALIAPVAPAAADSEPSTIEAILPPAVPWDGASRSLALPAASDDPWLTPSERSGLRTTPGYDETVDYLRRLTAAAPELSMVSLGTSGEQREIWMVIASKDGDLTPEAMARRGKPIVLAQAGIHSGEIDGKDAGLMLLRDLTVRAEETGRGALLDDVQLLFVPILNVDGHERRTVYSRMNQRGPERPGWRTNARNRNLNRDYAKLDTPEVRAIVRAIERWRPDLYIDLHVTDGIDYEYDITWGGAGEQSWSPAVSRVLEGSVRPAVAADLERAGHVPGDLVFAIDGQNPDRGLYHWTAAGPRFSDGYGAARGLPTILVENHSLDPYDQRVLGTYVFLASMLEAVGEHGEALQSAVRADRALRPDPLTLGWTVDREAAESVDFRGVAWRKEASEVSGDDYVVWTGVAERTTLPRVGPTVPEVQAARPVAYWVPAPWTEVIERLELHGIRTERLAAPRTLELELDQVAARLAAEPFEGRARVELTDEPTPLRRRVEMPAGSVRVPTDQPLGDLAMLLLEPRSTDSLFQWGFFLGILQRTEYYERYVFEPTAQAMLAADPALRAAFDAALEADAELAADPRARLDWLYQRSPWLDERWKVYPVGRER
ncbi:MAG: M14 family metallopeptidase [Acidobacteriota bacterium]